MSKEHILFISAGAHIDETYWEVTLQNLNPTHVFCMLPENKGIRTDMHRYKMRHPFYIEEKPREYREAIKNLENS